MWLDKVETWDLAHQVGILDVVIKESHTCYNGDRTSLLGCQTCPACHLRNTSLFEFAEKNGIDLAQYGIEVK